MMQFMGYRRPDGRAGVRNHVLILSTVTCANTVVEKIGRALDDQAISIIHAAGCGQGGDDLEQTHRVLLGTATHPNVGAVLLIGLGCESLDTVALAGEVAATGKPTEHFLIQDVGGTTSAVERGIAIAHELLAVTAETRSESIDVSELIVAVECGASDAFSAVTANPAAGVVADRVVEAGGTFMFSEVDECIGAEHILARRARDEATAQKLLEFIGRREREAAAAGTILEGEETIEQVGGRISEKLLAVAGGELTQAEVLGHREFTINRIGPRL